RPARHPALETHVFEFVVEQFDRALRARSRLEWTTFPGPLYDLVAIAVTELPKADKDRATVLRCGNVRGPGRVAERHAGRVIAVFVLKDAVEDDDLLAAAVRMAGERAAWRVSYDRRRARHLVANAEQHAPIDASRRT